MDPTLSSLFSLYLLIFLFNKAGLTDYIPTKFMRVFFNNNYISSYNFFCQEETIRTIRMQIQQAAVWSKDQFH